MPRCGKKFWRDVVLFSYSATMGERKKRIGGTGMKWYAIGKTLTPLDRAPESGAAVVLLN